MAILVTFEVNGATSSKYDDVIRRLTEIGQRVVTRKGRTRQDVAYAVTSLSSQEAGPQRLLNLWRGHWGIENRVHWVRDVTFDEDRSQIRTGAAPQVAAALRNMTISLLRLANKPNIAAALRRNAAHPAEALALVGASLG